MIAERIRVSGVVQGVGFRPLVWRLAHELGVAGWVRNDAAGVEVHAEGKRQQLDVLRQRIRGEAPGLARVDAVVATPAVRQGLRDFVIAESQSGGINATAIGHDTAPCAECLSELLDPAGRRWRHAFITCTYCGPRFTLTRRLPYSRASTSLANFPLCADCAREYGDPSDRRFYAETLCCPACGPKLALLDMDGRPVPGDALAETMCLIRGGAIVAIKGLGGFNLVCDARNSVAVGQLRQRKNREEKPFALLLPNIASARLFAQVGNAESALLQSAERPIVLLRKKPVADVVLSGVAPGLACLGVMLPVAPVQWLLFHEAAGRRAGTDWLQTEQALALVSTSANPGDEPLVIGNEEALERLAGIADAVLLHDRDILVRCDDSVLAAAPAGASFVRRARGYTPRAIGLDMAGPSVLALGAGLKNTVCVTRGNEAFVSQHVGDLDSVAGREFFAETVTHLLGILEVEPELVAHDLHPDLYSSRFAAEFAAQRGLPLLAVPHHQAHIASVLAEHHVGDEPALGLALDGMGLGLDGSLWGGELLRLDGHDCSRLGHLLPLALPGGDRAAREPWRLAASVLQALGRGDEIAGRFIAQPGAAAIAEMLTRGIRTPPTSSLGRYFDAAAGLLDICPVVSFEGQAAMRLEGLATRHWPVAALHDGWRVTSDGVLDLLPMMAVLADCDDAPYGAALFHATLAAALADWVESVAQEQALRIVACGGGCFLNSILSSGLTAELASRKIKLLMARQLPPSDGGISLGQAWVALQTLRN